MITTLVDEVVKDITEVPKGGSVVIFRERCVPIVGRPPRQRTYEDFQQLTSHGLQVWFGSGTPTFFYPLQEDDATTNMERDRLAEAMKNKREVGQIRTQVYAEATRANNCAFTQLVHEASLQLAQQEAKKMVDSHNGRLFDIAKKIGFNANEVRARVEDLTEANKQITGEIVSYKRARNE